MTSHQFRTLLFIIILTQAIGFSLMWFVINKPVVGIPSHESSVAQLVQNEQIREHEMVRNIEPKNIGHTSSNFDIDVLKHVVQDVMRKELAEFSSDFSFSIESGIVDSARNDHSVSSPYHNKSTAQEIAPGYVRVEAMAHSQEIFDSALDSGVWELKDSEALLPHVMNLSEEQRNKLFKVFMEATLSGAMVNVGGFPPL